MSNVSAPALRYYGGKWRIAPAIIGYFPPHYCYCEPYGGGASVLLQKEPAQSEVYNDIESEVVNFFRVLRERPDEFIRAINLTPYSREEFDLAYAPADDPIESARRFYILIWQQRHGAKGKWRGGWRFTVTTPRSQIDQWTRTDHLWQIVARLKQVQIEHDDALNVIARYDAPETLFYVDPPYVQNTRGERWRSNGYRHEMDDDAHRQLADALHQVVGMVVLSGYAGTLYDKLYDWQQMQLAAVDNAGNTCAEVLWINERAWRRLHCDVSDLPLFAGGEA